MTNPNPNLPEELLIEVFSRLPAKFVARCRCLSKSWNRNLSTSQFFNLHLDRKSNPTDVPILATYPHGYRTFNLEGDDDTVNLRKLDFPAEFNRVVGSCNGLVLLSGPGLDELLVVNPLTLEQVRIRQRSSGGNTDFISYGFGYDSCTDDYKIVRLLCNVDIHTGAKDFRTVVHVYTLRMGAWKRINDSPYIHHSYDGVLLNGAIHWSASAAPNQSVIAAFDVASELFHDFPAPNVTHHNRIFAYGGCLSLICSGDIWTMNEYGNEYSWTKLSMVSDYRRSTMFLIGENDVLVSTKGKVILQNLKEGTTKDLIADGALGTLTGAFTYVESLVSPVYYLIVNRCEVAEEQDRTC